MTTQVAGLLLAAGAGRRYGMPKALIELDSQLLVDRAAGVLRAGGCDPVVVVLGAAGATVRRRASLTGAWVVRNHRWRTGMGSSLRTGLARLCSLPPDVVAAIVLPVDLPDVGPAAIRLLATDATPNSLAAATYRGERGHPVLLGRTHWPAIATTATADVGARPYLRVHPPTLIPCDHLATGTDIDHPTDLPHTPPPPH